MGPHRQKIRPENKAVRFTAIFLASYFAIWPIHATTIVAFKDASGIYIGADSRISKTRLSDGKAIPDRDTCKIRIAKDVVFAQSGWYWHPDDFGGKTDFISMTDNAMLQPGDFVTKIKGFETTGKRDLETEIRRLRKNAPEYVKSANWKTFSPVEAIFFHSERGQVTMIREDFKISIDGDTITVDANRQTCAQGCGTPTGTFQFTVLGNGGAISKVDIRDFFSIGHIADGIRRLIDMEIKADPIRDGRPISILRIANDGVPHWINRGVCEAK